MVIAQWGTASPSAGNAAMNKQTILLVEDNHDDEELTLHALRMNDISNPVMVVRDGIEALDYLLGRGNYTERDVNSMPCLVLMDLNLPKMNGLEVLKHIRSEPQTRSLPVVILTASTEQRAIASRYLLFANSFIQKPTNFLDFVEIIRQIAAYWLTFDQASPTS